MKLITSGNRVSLIKKVDSILGNTLASLLPRPPQVSKNLIESVLFIRPGGIGDALLLAPAIKTFRRHYPDALISVLAEKRNAGAFALIPSVDKLYTYDSFKGVFDISKSRYDLIIDTEQWHRLSAVFARILPSSLKIGFNTNNRSRLFTDRSNYSQGDYEAQSFLNLLIPLGIFEYFDPESSFLDLPEIASMQASEILMSKSPYVTIFPGASIRERHWGCAKFNNLARLLSNKGILPVIIGGVDEKLFGEAIVDGTCGLNFAGKTSLQVTAALISKSELLVSSDSGVLHIGAGLGKKTVSLFGSGIAEKWAPRGNRHKVVNRNIPCSPCTLFGTTPRCNIGVKCLNDIDVQDVYLAVESLLNL